MRWGKQQNMLHVLLSDRGSQNGRGLAQKMKRTVSSVCALGVSSVCVVGVSSVCALGVSSVCALGE